MIIQSAKFVKSSPEFKLCPDSKIPEYAFIGRSNVGKSSLINMITGRSKLAKTSGTPGKTQLINHFLINDSWHLVDLPGYGFAKISKSIRGTWEKMIHEFLINRANLVTTFILIDIRHEPQKLDMDFIRWFGSKQLPFVLAFTKADKLGVNILKHKVASYQESLLAEWEELPLSIVTSATTQKGKEEILDFIGEMNEEYESFYGEKSV